MNTRIGDHMEERDLLQDTDTHSTVSIPFHRRQSTFTAGSSSSRRYSTVSESSNITLTHFTAKNKKTDAYPNWFKDKLLQEYKIKQVLDETLEEHFMPAIYDGQESKKLCLTLADLLLERVKPFNQQRFKLVCIVSIVADKKQGVMVGSRCLWNTETDRCISVSKHNSTMIAVVTVYGLYYE
ncbi:dynein light chain Tctex-type 5-like isoform X2 [Dysidea avara]|uniref:dynein light chain Tctex-type 5-like isoform X2 n=1 Tax=Dysidea avara TaxID=196820 RepID=UPI00331A1BFB